MRYFRTDSDAVYEQARITLDAAWGHPTPDGHTVTCIQPAATAPRDSAGRIVLAVDDGFCEYTVAVDLLPQLLASGTVVEIAAAEYLAAIPTAPL
jgi:hypothetical protein